METAPSKETPGTGIQWKAVTWYSKLLSVIFFLIVYPILAFYIGTLYQETVQLSEEPTRDFGSTQFLWAGTWMWGSYGNDTLTIENVTNTGFSFNLRTIGGNSHLGEIEGKAVFTEKGTAQWKESPDSACNLKFVSTPRGISLKVGEEKAYDPCSDYHGARAAFNEGIYERKEIAQGKIIAKVFENEAEGAGLLSAIGNKELVFFSFLDKVSLTKTFPEASTAVRIYEGSSGDYSKYSIGAPSYIEYRTIILTKQDCHVCRAEVWTAITNSYDGKTAVYSTEKDTANPTSIDEWIARMETWYRSIPKDRG